jgi:hypothetical protein
MQPTLVNLVAAVASAVAAIAAVVVAVILGLRTEAVSVALRRHSAFNAVAEWRRGLTIWAAEAVDVLSEASYRCGEEAPAERAEQLLVCRFRISALIDRGRFFLPNIKQDEHGTDKPAAYRGFRHAALDPLVAADRVLSTGQIGSFANQCYALNAMRREFVSALQLIIGPQRSNQEIANMIGESGEKGGSDRTCGGLLSDDIPRGADELLLKPPFRHPGIRDAGSAIAPQEERRSGSPRS